MLNYLRPIKPDDFQQKSDDELRKVTLQIAKNPDKLKFTDSFWGKYKNHFMTVQFKKCGYCESFITSYGDVEHYRPKSVVEEIEERGNEAEGLNNVRGRKFKKGCKYGYWWLAYDWDNYLLACTLCNQPWKKALFPILEARIEETEQGSAYPYLPPNIEDIETPLLLNPFQGVRLSEHFDYSDTGLIKPFQQSEYGRHTIITCGLDRTSLTQFRSKKAMRVTRYIDKFAMVEANSERELEIAIEILELGNEDDSYAGMVRTIFERKANGYFWQDLCDFVKARSDE
jgi:hypothetical protein